MTCCEPIEIRSVRRRRWKNRVRWLFGSPGNLASELARNPEETMHSALQDEGSRESCIGRVVSTIEGRCVNAEA